MSHVHPRPPFAQTKVKVLSTLVLLAAAAAAVAPVLARQPGAAANGDAAGRQRGAAAKVPPLPEGTPEQLMEFVEKLQKTPMPQSSRQEMMAHRRDVVAVTLQAADKILAQVKQADPLYVRAARLKLKCLNTLGNLGDEKAAADFEAYATSLVDSPTRELAREAQVAVLVADAQKILSAGDVPGAQSLVERMTKMLSADPDDLETARLAMGLIGAFEQMPGGDDVAASAYRSFGPVMAKSSNDQIRSRGESFAGVLRRLSLPGKPMEIKGTLLDGKPFDQKSLAGKVVLVDFWATWCGPCVAEIPNVLEQYAKYHDKGFEVVGISLDQDRGALEKFVGDRKIPWPILFENPEGDDWQHPLATYYGITGIPTVVLIGRDGNVITLDARGEKLGERLDEIFKKAG